MTEQRPRSISFTWHYIDEEGFPEVNQDYLILTRGGVESSYLEDVVGVWWNNAHTVIAWAHIRDGV
jgi:hypothetical protein